MLKNAIENKENNSFKMASELISPLSQFPKKRNLFDFNKKNRPNNTSENNKFGMKQKIFSEADKSIENISSLKISPFLS